MIGAAIITALSSVYFDISTKMSRELPGLRANFFIGPERISSSRIADARMKSRMRSIVPPDKLIGVPICTGGKA
jgi:putative ABC transport system permease protein